MSKKVLTGGTGDVNPQIAHFFVNQLTVDGGGLLTTSTFQLPLWPYTTPKDKAAVIELLRAEAQFDADELYGTASVTGGWEVESTLSIAQVNNAWPQADVNTIAHHTIVTIGTTTTINNLLNIPVTKSFDLTDGAGHGVVIPRRTVVVNLGSAGTQVMNNITWRILYRFKLVTITEWLTMQGQVQTLST